MPGSKPYTLQQSLTVKFFYLLVLYILAGLLLVFLSFHARFGLGWDALIKSPAGDRIEVVADSLAQRLGQTSEENWNKTLAEFDQIYQVKFSLFSPDGRQLAGDAVQLPQPLRERLTPPGPHLFGPGPFKPDPFGPPPHPSEFALEPGKPGPPPFAPRFAPPLLPPPPAFERNGPPPPPMPEEFKRAHGRFLFRSENPDMFWLGCRLVIQPPGQPRPQPCTVIARTNNIWQSSLLIDLKFILLILSAVLLLSLCFWLPFIISITRKLSELTRATEKIADGQFETRLQHQGHDEISRLAEAINSMSERINIFVSGQKRLMGDISHELCSPIARLQIALELLEETAEPEAQPLINDIREEVTEMNNLVNELLAFSKAEMKNAVKNLVSVPVAPLLEKLNERLIPAGRASLVVADDLVAIADPMLLERGIGNVLRNSVRYGGTEGHINITADRNSKNRGQIVIVIADDGPGVPEEALKHLGEPFFRPDSARSRSQGGAGLGLAIVKSCVAACEGTIEIKNGEPRGLRIEITLPAA
jgi:two-component system sensor histidine kinase CpxA